MPSGTHARGAIAASVCAVLSWATTGSTAELRWTAPEECQKAEDVAREVTDVLGRPIESVDTVDFEAEVAKADDGTWRLVLHTVDRVTSERRSRELQGASCAEVTDAVAVAIAMAIRSGQEQAREADENASPPAAEAAPDAPEMAERSVVRDRPRQSKPGPPRAGRAAAQVRPSVSLSAVADAGALPGLSPGAELRGSLGWQSMRASAFGALFVEQTEEVSGGGGGEFQLAVGGVLACVERPPNGLGLTGCVGFELGRLHGRGVGIDDPRQGSATWAAPRAEAGIALPLIAATAVVARAGAALPLTRPEFVIAATEPVHRPSSVTLRLSLGIEVGL